MSDSDSLLESLPPARRLALAYAPAAARLPLLAFLALDVRLAGIVRNSHEPMLAQLRLAWWREQLQRDGGAWPEGEPLLAALRSWDGRHDALVPLVDAWEGMTGAPPLDPAVFEALAQALQARVNIPVVLQDERLSSREAESRLALRERDWRRRKAKLDAAAAAVVLQDYLDSRR